jgi:hypothetical protein
MNESVKKKIITLIINMFTESEIKIFPLLINLAD